MSTWWEDVRVVAAVRDRRCRRRPAVLDTRKTSHDEGQSGVPGANILM